MNWFEAMSKKPIKVGTKIEVQESKCTKGKSATKKSAKSS